MAAEDIWHCAIGWKYDQTMKQHVNGATGMALELILVNKGWPVVGDRVLVGTGVAWYHVTAVNRTDGTVTVASAVEWTEKSDEAKTVEARPSQLVLRCDAYKRVIKRRNATCSCTLKT
jgi:hypothetical protein